MFTRGFVVVQCIQVPHVVVTERRHLEQFAYQHQEYKQYFHIYKRCLKTFLFSSSNSTMRFIHINEYEYINNDVSLTLYIKFTHTYSNLYLCCVHTLQHLYHNIDVTNIQFKGLIFSRPPAVYDM